MLGTLTGWAKAHKGSIAEHTYVTCDGETWACFGESSGGKEITRGAGSTAMAHCISLPAQTAGIVYGLSGLCHQAANRILWPARTLVTGARGYWLSALLYGTYGTSDLEWLARMGMCSCFTGESSHFDKTAKKDEHEVIRLGRADRAYHRSVRTLYSKAFMLQDLPGTRERGAIDINILARDRDLLMDYKLGENYRPGKRKSIMKRLRRFHSTKKQLDRALHMEELSLREYTTRVNAEAEFFLDFCAGLLGNEDYTRLIGIKPGENIKVVDEIIASEFLAF
ncbi:hypothetical protein ACFLZI_01390 [Nitrospirota bacterium]